MECGERVTALSVATYRDHVKWIQVKSWATGRPEIKAVTDHRTPKEMTVFITTSEVRTTGDVKANCQRRKFAYNLDAISSRDNEKDRRNERLRTVVVRQ